MEGGVDRLKLANYVFDLEAKGEKVKIPLRQQQKKPVDKKRRNLKGKSVKLKKKHCVYFVVTQKEPLHFFHVDI